MSCAYLAFQVVCGFHDFLVSYKSITFCLTERFRHNCVLHRTRNDESVQNILDILLQSPRKYLRKLVQQRGLLFGSVKVKGKGKAIPVTGRGGP
jgi:hypothetical protein